MLTLLVGTLAWPSVASAQTLTAIWQQFFHGCAEDPANRALCACAATEFITRCQADGSRSPAQLAQCIERNQDRWVDPIVAVCQPYGALRVGPPVATPTPRPVTGRGATMSQGDLWTAGYEGCEANMPSGESREYACSCVATFVVQSCAPTPDVPAAHVSSCVPALRSEISRITPQCMQFGALATSSSASPTAPASVAPAAAPAAPVHPVAQRLCERSDLPDAAQRLECARVLSTVFASDLEAFLAYLPATERVRLFRNARATPAAIRTHFARNGGLQALFSAPHADVYVVTERGAPVLVLFDSDVVDGSPPEARFRWDAPSQRWVMVSVADAPR